MNMRLVLLETRELIKLVVYLQALTAVVAVEKLCNRSRRQTLFYRGTMVDMVFHAENGCRVSRFSCAVLDSVVVASTRAQVVRNPTTSFCVLFS